MVDIDRAVHVRFGKAIGGGVQFRHRLWRVQAQRVKISRQMAATAVSRYHLAHPHRIHHRLTQIFVGNPRTHLGGFGFQGFFDLDRIIGPLPVHRGDQITVGGRWPVGAGPRRALRLFFHILIGVVETGEIGGPDLVHRGRIIRKPRLHLFKINGVDALQVRRRLKVLVGWLVGHDNSGPNGPLRFKVFWSNPSHQPFRPVDTPGSARPAPRRALRTHPGQALPSVL